MTPLIVLTLLAQSPALPGGVGLTEKLACAPINAPAPPVDGMRVSGSAFHGRVMFGPGDTVVVNAGSQQGVQVGQMYYVRRHVRDNFTPAAPDFVPISIHTAGWVTIVKANDVVSFARVTHACDAVQYGDYLEPFTPSQVPEPLPGGEPDYASPARIVLADERRQIGTEGSMMLINRGTEQGVRAGQTVTIFRPTMDGMGPALDIGRATILSVRQKTSLLRIDSSRDAVFIGDLAAFAK